jgi:hypothetical protein
MLTQRTIAKFQRFLSGLMQHEFFGMNGIYSVLPPANYYNLLYEADVPRQLLDVLMKRTCFNAVPATLALYEGHAVAEASIPMSTITTDRWASRTCCASWPSPSGRMSGWSGSVVAFSRTTHVNSRKAWSRTDSFITLGRCTKQPQAIASCQCHSMGIHPVQWFLQKALCCDHGARRRSS